MDMQVMFYKVDNGRLCGWDAIPPKRKRFQGTMMASGRDLPHDLAQFVDVGPVDRAVFQADAVVRPTDDASVNSRRAPASSPSRAEWPDVCRRRLRSRPNVSAHTAW